jgi:predicted nucleic acid-binding protein
MIFVDTGAWYASVVRNDRHHASAAGWIAANRQTLVTTDYVIAETVTLLRARGERRFAIQVGERRGARVHFLAEDELLLAWNVFRRFTDKDWSFTDCTSKVVMERLGITTAFAFDQHFRQFGTVSVVPSSDPSPGAG